MRISIGFFVTIEADDGSTKTFEPQSVFVDLSDEAKDALGRLEHMKDEIDGARGVTVAMLEEAKAEFAHALGVVQPFFNAAGLAIGRVSRMTAQTHLAPKGEEVG